MLVFLLLTFLSVCPTSKQHGVSTQIPPVNLLNLTSKAICCQRCSLTRPHPKQVATQSGQITNFPFHSYLALKGILISPFNTTCMASKSGNPVLYRKTHQQQFWLSFPSSQQGFGRTCQSLCSA